MRIDILTLFPEMFAPIKTSLLQKAVDKKAIEINVINIRDFSKDKHKKCDDYPYGGGAGLVMTPEPIAESFKSINNYKQAHKIFMSPKGQTLNQNKVIQLSKMSHLIILCGHYEGVDERIINNYIDEEISIGDYVLTGGEIPALALADSVSRYIDGVIGNSESLCEESFASGMLEYPQYTHPREFEGEAVPEVLLNGNHKLIEKWREEKSAEITQKRRPDLINK